MNIPFDILGPIDFMSKAGELELSNIHTTTAFLSIYACMYMIIDLYNTF